LALSSRSKHLLALVGGILLGAEAPTVARAQEPIELSDSLRAATDELPVRFRTRLSGMWNYRFGEFLVLNREGGVGSSAGRTRGPILDRSAVTRDRTAFRYEVRGEDSASVRVRIRSVGGTVVKRPFTIGSRIETSDDTVEVADTTIASFVFEDDTAGAWELRMVERSGTAVPHGYAFEGTVTRGERIIRLAPVSSPERPRRGGFAGLISWQGHGFVLEENGRGFAAVQYVNGGYRPSENLKVWMPKSAAARERLELAAIFTAVMATGQEQAGRTGEPTP